MIYCNFIAKVLSNDCHVNITFVIEIKVLQLKRKRKAGIAGILGV
jgi:hypothetical protein